MNFLMTTWDGAGTTPPLMSVARALAGRGHRVRVMADPTLQTDVEATGAEYIGWARAPHRTNREVDGDFVRDWEPDSPVEGFGRMRDRLAVGAAGVFAAEVRAEVGRERPDAILTELLLFGPLIAAEAEHIPSIVLNPTINIVPAEGVPPFGFGFPLARTAEERQRDVEFGTAAAALWNEALPAFNDARAENGLGPLNHVLDQGRSAARVLVMTSQTFDFPAALPPAVKHVGPRLDDPVWVEPWDAPPGDEPLVLVAFSSYFQNQASLLQRVVDAVVPLPVRVVVTTGAGVDPEALSVPSHVQVVRSAPHSKVLQHASLVVTHAGHGTVIKALAAGVPLVCLPMGRDQLDVAARVVHAGAGARLDPSAEAEEIADAIRNVLHDPTYDAAARRVAAAIAEETSSDAAVSEIESVVMERNVTRC